MMHRDRLRQIVLLLLSSLLFFAALATHAERIYSDEELETMPAPGPNPYISFLPAGTEVDWDYWNEKREYEGRKRAEARQASATEGGSVAEVEPNDTLATAQLIAGFGTGPGDDASLDVTGTIDAGGDVDCFEVDLEVGDILGINQTGAPNLVEIFEPGGDLQMGSSQDGSFIYPAASPMPGGGNAGDHITYTSGGHFVCVRTSSGAYTLQLRVFRSVFESGGVQTLFVDFDEKGIRLDELLDEFGALEMNEVLFECGPTLAGRVLELGLADEVVVYLAPVLLGPDARPLANIPPVADMSDRLELDLVDIATFGSDIRITLASRSVDR